MQIQTNGPITTKRQALKEARAVVDAKQGGGLTIFLDGGFEITFDKASHDDLIAVLLFLTED